MFPRRIGQWCSRLVPASASSLRSLVAKQQASALVGRTGTRAIYPRRKRLIDVQASVIQVRREPDGMRKRVGRIRLVEGRFGLQKQSRAACNQWRTERRAGRARVRPAREGADDVLAGRGNPHVGRAVIRKGRALVPIGGRSDAHYVAFECSRIDSCACALISRCCHQNHTLLVRIGNRLAERRRRAGNIEAHIHHIGLMLHGVIQRVKLKTQVVGLAIFTGPAHWSYLNCSINPRTWLSGISLELMDWTSNLSIKVSGPRETLPVTVTRRRSYCLSSFVFPRTEYCFPGVINPHWDKPSGQVHLSLGTSAGHSSHRRSLTSKMPVSVVTLLRDSTEFFSVCA